MANPAVAFAQSGSGSNASLRHFRQPWIDLDDKSVLITGGTGSFGRQFVSTVVSRYRPRRLVIFARDETKHADLEKKYPNEQYPFIRYFVGDIRDRERLQLALHDIEFVVHAAALTHVPTAEYNPFECIRTNIIGTENLVHAALEGNVRKVVVISSDAAASPVNLYGASKLAGEKIVAAANNVSGRNGPRFSVARYGNVINSRGSASALFRKLAAEGADSLPIADERMTRFWITPEQAANFVLSSLEMMRGGEIFIPKLPSATLADMASAIAPGVKQRILGSRFGEKLHETLISADDSEWTVEMEDRYAILAGFNATREFYLNTGAKAVPDDFHYSSKTNPELLGTRGIRALLGGCFPAEE